MRKIILASSSPRRNELLKNLNIPFEVCVPEVDENLDKSLPCDRYVQELALLKGSAVLQECMREKRDAVVIAADTVVSKDGVILGKPRDVDEARMMLSMLSGKAHEGAHFAAASFLGIGFSSISIMPFGLNISLKQAYIEDPQKEFWICFAGPFANIALFTAGLMIAMNQHIESPYMHFFLSANMMMFFLNMLPILPLDGGRMLKSLLTDNYGAIKAFNFTYRIGKIALLVFFVVMCYILYTEKFNFSFIIL